MAFPTQLTSTLPIATKRTPRPLTFHQAHEQAPTAPSPCTSSVCGAGGALCTEGRVPFPAPSSGNSSGPEAAAAPKTGGCSASTSSTHQIPCFWEQTTGLNPALPRAAAAPGGTAARWLRAPFRFRFPARQRPPRPSRARRERPRL